MVIDPREVLLGMRIDELEHGRDVSDHRELRGDLADRASEDAADESVLSQVKRLRKTVEVDHDRRLRGIEINVRWLMVLVGGEILAIVGFALGTVNGF